MRVAVIGCGVMGAACAWELSHRGHEVTIYEQFEVGHPRGSSHGPTRVYRYSYPLPAYVAMMKEAVPLWRRLEADAGAQLLQRTGGLDTGPDLHSHAAALSAHGIPYEIVDAAAAADRWPDLSLIDDEILFQADGGVVHAERALGAFVDGAVRRGALLMTHRRIPDLSSGGTAGHDVTVVTAGGWARELLATAGIDLRVTPTRETIAFFRTAVVVPTLVDWGDPSVYALHDPVYGLKVGEHIAGPATDPHQEGVVDRSSVARLEAWVKERYPGIDPEAVYAETCIYTNSADEHFVLERHGNIVVGSPCSGHGFKFAPLIGKRLADLVES